MKKYMLCLAAVVISAVSVKAQFSLGVKGGLNISKIDNDNYSQSTVAGYQFGAFARIGTGFYVQPELYVGSKGGKFNFDSNGSNAGGSAKVRFTSLDVPVLIGKSFGAESLNFRIMAGPIYSYILNTDESFSDNLGAAYRDLGNYKNSTLGYQAGAGIDLGNISIDARYEGGLTQVNEKFGQRQNLWHISLGFKIL
ncbi:PorT family protein [Mucilaginibacter sp. HMF5004]|uniref:porin family protein n=1 Tax=Mucilaginibacter rivuli TaxID=2857527 RepID=UPI001C5E17A4|nr:porin family protein [Mucilaginibacter rivuli]MBW4890189.1 PorT family protein [Mucilaginibacter rivuli]